MRRLVRGGGSDKFRTWWTGGFAASLPRMSPLPGPDCLLFDLDGTLVDSVTDISRSANHVRRSLGMGPLAESELAGYVGDGATMLMRRALAGRHDEPELPAGVDLREQIRKFRAHYHEHCLEHTRPYPGVIETLRALAPLPMAIVSNKPEAMCEKIAAGLGMTAWLGAVVGAQPDVPVKPDPALLGVALERLGVAPGPGVWMVGDSPNDILAARALGLGAIAVSWGLSDPATLAGYAPDRMLTRFDELAGSLT